MISDQSLLLSTIILNDIYIYIPDKLKGKQHHHTCHLQANQYSYFLKVMTLTLWENICTSIMCQYGSYGNAVRMPVALILYSYTLIQV